MPIKLVPVGTQGGGTLYEICASDPSTGQHIGIGYTALDIDGNPIALALDATVSNGNALLTEISAALAEVSTEATQNNILLGLTALSGVIGTEADAPWSGSGIGTAIAILKKIAAGFGSVVLGAGSAIIGSVRVDQTTPGTTNGVVVNASVLPIGAAEEDGNLAAINAKLGGALTVIAGNAGSGADASQGTAAVGTVQKTMTVTHPGNYFIQNQSDVIIQAVFDGGNTGPTVFLLASGGLNQPGGVAPVISAFTGRIRICGPNGIAFAARSI